MTSEEVVRMTDDPAGSPSSGEPAFILIGKIRRPHGVSGELLMEVYSEFPERIVEGMEVFIGEDREPWQIRNLRVHGRGLLLGFDGIADPESAGMFRNQMVYVRSDKIPPLPEGEYYHHQLIGLQVFQAGGEFLGEIAGLLETGANDVCVIRTENGAEILLPMIDSVVVNIDLDQQIMTVRLLEGLLPDH